ncbi:hypothetical protein ACHAQI_011161 [Fusarium lateritium]
MSSENPHSKAYLEANKGPAILGIVLTVSILSTVFVFGRVFTRKRIIGALHLDDWFTIVALWCQVAVTIVAVRDGNGRHFDTLTVSQQQNAIFFTVLGFPFGVMAFGFPKLAVVALIARLMNPGRVHRIFLWTLAGCCMLSLVGCIIILFAQCSPVESQWDFSITDKSCWSPYILIDFAIFSGGKTAASLLRLLY